MLESFIILMVVLLFGTIFGTIIFSILLLLVIIIDLIFDIDIIEEIKYKYMGILKYIKDRKLKKNINNKKKKLEKKLKKNDSMNYEALKFEYSFVYKIVNEEIKKLNINVSQVNEIYLILLHENFKRISKIRKIERNSFEFLACVYGALKEENPLTNLDLKAYIRHDVEQRFIDNVMEALQRTYPKLYYNNSLVEKKNKDDIKNKCYFECRAYNDKIFDFAFTLIDKII